MAQITILSNYKKTLWGLIDNGLMNKLKNGRFLVDLNFIDEESFNSFVKGGFDPNEWEIKNENKVLINNIPYKEHLKTL